MPLSTTLSEFSADKRPRIRILTCFTSDGDIPMDDLDFARLQRSLTDRSRSWRSVALDDGAAPTLESIPGNDSARG